MFKLFSNLNYNPVKYVPFFRGKGEYQIDFVPAPRITEADKTNDKRY